MTNPSPTPGDCAPGSIGVVLVEKSAGVISVRYAERATPSPGAGELLVSRPTSASAAPTWSSCTTRCRRTSPSASRTPSAMNGQERC